MCVATSSTTVIEWIAIRNPDLQAPDVRGTLRLHSALAATITMFVVLAIVLVFPEIGLWSLLLLFPAGYIGERLEKRDRSR